MRRLLRCPRGVAAVEFALLGPAFFAFIFLVIEGGRMIWTQQVLQQTAVAGARCLGMKSSDCKNEAEAKAWVIKNALKSGIRLSSNSIGVISSADCSRPESVSQIIIENHYSNVVGAILPSSMDLPDVTGRYPCLPAAS